MIEDILIRTARRVAERVGGDGVQAGEITVHEVHHAVDQVLSGELARLADAEMQRYVAERARRTPGDLPRLLVQFSPEGVCDVVEECNSRKPSAIAALALAVLVECLCVKLIDVAQRFAKSVKAKRVAPSHLKRAIAADPDLASLCDGLGIAYH